MEDVVAFVPDRSHLSAAGRSCPHPIIRSERVFPERPFQLFGKRGADLCIRRIVDAIDALIGIKQQVVQLMPAAYALMNVFVPAGTDHSYGPVFVQDADSALNRFTSFGEFGKEGLSREFILRGCMDRLSQKFPKRGQNVAVADQVVDDGAFPEYPPAPRR